MGDVELQDQHKSISTSGSLATACHGEQGGNTVTVQAPVSTKRRIRRRDSRIQPPPSTVSVAGPARSDAQETSVNQQPSAFPQPHPSTYRFPGSFPHQAQQYLPQPSQAFSNQSSLFSAHGSSGFPHQSPVLPHQSSPFAHRLSLFPRQLSPFPYQSSPFSHQSSVFPQQSSPLVHRPWIFSPDCTQQARPYHSPGPLHGAEAAVNRTQICHHCMSALPPCLAAVIPSHHWAYLSQQSAVLHHQQQRAGFLPHQQASAPLPRPSAVPTRRSANSGRISVTPSHDVATASGHVAGSSPHMPTPTHWSATSSRHVAGNSHQTAVCAHNSTAASRGFPLLSGRSTTGSQLSPLPSHQTVLSSRQSALPSYQPTVSSHQWALPAHQLASPSHQSVIDSRQLTAPSLRLAASPQQSLMSTHQPAFPSRQLEASSCRWADSLRLQSAKPAFCSRQPTFPSSQPSLPYHQLNLPLDLILLQSTAPSLELAPVSCQYDSAATSHPLKSPSPKTSDTTVTSQLSVTVSHQCDSRSSSQQAGSTSQRSHSLVPLKNSTLPSFQSAARSQQSAFTLHESDFSVSPWQSTLPSLKLELEDSSCQSETQPKYEAGAPSLQSRVATPCHQSLQSDFTFRLDQPAVSLFQSGSTTPLHNSAFPPLQSDARAPAPASVAYQSESVPVLRCPTHSSKRGGSKEAAAKKIPDRINHTGKVKAQREGPYGSSFSEKAAPSRGVPVSAVTTASKHTAVKLLARDGTSGSCDMPQQHTDVVSNVRPPSQSGSLAHNDCVKIRPSRRIVTPLAESTLLEGMPSPGLLDLIFLESFEATPSHGVKESPEFEATPLLNFQPLAKSTPLRVVPSPDLNKRIKLEFTFCSDVNEILDIETTPTLDLNKRIKLEASSSPGLPERLEEFETMPSLYINQQTGQGERFESTPFFDLNKRIKMEATSPPDNDEHIHLEGVVPLELNEQGTFETTSSPALNMRCEEVELTTAYEDLNDKTECEARTFEGPDWRLKSNLAKAVSLLKDKLKFVAGTTSVQTQKLKVKRKALAQNQKPEATASTEGSEHESAPQNKRLKAHTSLMNKLQAATENEQLEGSINPKDVAGCMESEPAESTKLVMKLAQPAFDHPEKWVASTSDHYNQYTGTTHMVHQKQPTTRTRHLPNMCSTSLSTLSQQKEKKKVCSRRKRQSPCKDAESRIIYKVKQTTTNASQKK